jgi:2-C-methyl-D-erythritol 4-phosphate cytidylyltransferase
MPVKADGASRERFSAFRGCALQQVHLPLPAIKMTDAIIAAAGNSERFGQDKLFLNVLGKPVIFYAVRAFENSSVDRIIISCKKEKIPYLEGSSLLWKDNYRWGKELLFCAGGSTRAESVYNALRMSSGDFVSIHDGARPLVTPELINRSIEDCIKYGSSVLALNPADAVKRAGAHFENIPRKEIYLAQTPQTFPRDKIICAYGQFFSANPNAFPDDDCEVFSKYYPVHFTEGERANIKITYKSDLEFLMKMIE